MRDEEYIINICDDVLGKKCYRQYRKFYFLRGDCNRRGGRGRMLPVDAYYEDLSLVIEYNERQHTESISHFDKPNKMTVSGVHRGEQRRIYDERRRKVLPQNNIQLIEISYQHFEFTKQKRLVRNSSKDRKIVEKILHQFLEH